MKNEKVMNLVYHIEAKKRDDYLYVQKVMQGKHLGIDNNLGMSDRFPLVSDMGIAGTFFVLYVAAHIILHGARGLFRLRVYE